MAADFESTSPAKAAQCALVIEDEPQGADSRLYFESFPQDGIERAYNLADYQKLGGTRMPQPAYAIYAGGDWGPFTLKLEFHAGFGSGQALQQQDLETLRASNFDDVLIQMERKVAWCEALGFPLDRESKTGKRILARARTFGIVPSAATTKAADKLKRADPPYVLIVFGSWLVLRGYMTNVRTRFMAPFHPLTARPFSAEVSMTFQLIMAEYPTWQTIRNQPGRNGFTVGTTNLVVASQAAADQQARQNRDQANAGVTIRGRTFFGSG